MALEYAVYQTDNMESGKFYLLEVNKDLAPNFREVRSITGPLEKAGTDIVELNARIGFQEVKTELLENSFGDYTKIILDNQARINNLEDVEINKIINLVDKWSIRANFENALNVEIQHFRKHITSVKVMRVDSDTGIERIETNITAGTNVTERFAKDQNGNVISKKVVLNFGNMPITGYAIIL